MPLFWIAVVALTLIALAAVVWPLLRTDTPLADERDSRLSVYRARKREVDEDVASGRLTAQAGEEVLDELAKQASELPLAASAGSPLGRWWLPLAVIVLAPLLAVLIYTQVGAPALLPMQAALDQQRQMADELAQATRQLEILTRQRPDDAVSWSKLGQAYRLGGQTARAITAYERSLALDARQPVTQAELAEVLAQQAGGDFSGRPVKLLEDAYAMDRSNPKVLALFGAAQYQLGHRERAAELLGALLAIIPADAAGRAQLQAVHDRLAAETGGARQGDAQAGQASIRGTIRLAPALQSRLTAGAILFITARAAEGPRMPYAAIRRPAETPGPYSFELSDAQAMDPSRLLSSAGPVVIEARISRSGNALRQAGDLFGISAPMAATTSSAVEITIDQIVP